MGMELGVQWDRPGRAYSKMVRHSTNNKWAGLGTPRSAFGKELNGLDQHGTVHLKPLAATKLQFPNICMDNGKKSVSSGDKQRIKIKNKVIQLESRRFGKIISRGVKSLAFPRNPNILVGCAFAI